jgi:hypothetical protein
MKRRKGETAGEDDWPGPGIEERWGRRVWLAAAVTRRPCEPAKNTTKLTLELCCSYVADRITAPKKSFGH